ncbi:MAG: hypothetical protein AAGF95_28130 [Chloroflexota bacterium]
MKYVRRFRAIIIVILIPVIIAVLALFIGWPLPPDPMSLQRIEYRFRDSSVPPEYHRSYTIIATPQEATIVVDSYGDILAEERYIITEQQFRAIGQSLVDNRIRYAPLSFLFRENDCEGGTRETVVYSDGNKKLFRAYGARPNTRGECGYGLLDGNIEKFSSDIRQLIPDFDTLTEVSL